MRLLFGTGTDEGARAVERLPPSKNPDYNPIVIGLGGENAKVTTVAGALYATPKIGRHKTNHKVSTTAEIS